MAETVRPLRILLTNNSLGLHAGSELYVRDLAVALMKRGHLPVAYSPVLGAVAEELRALTVPVVDDLDAMETPPDLIHGQHHHETMTAVLRYPRTPALYVCHGWAPWEELPPSFPTILQHVAVDDLCRERLLTTPGIPPERVTTLYNFVDLERFGRRRALNAAPKSALVFSNYATDVSREISTACRDAGIERVDIVGAGSGNHVARPEEILADYDIVFAKARAALEAMATGCAVVVTDYAGLGGMVTSANVDRLRALNFGVRAMKNAPMTTDGLARELALYDAEDARRVSERIRREADMAAAVDRWLDIYATVMERWQREGQAISDASRLHAASRYLRFLAPVVKERRENEKLLKKAQGEREELADRLAEREAELAAIRRTLVWKAWQRLRKVGPWT